MSLYDNRQYVARYRGGTLASLTPRNFPGNHGQRYGQGVTGGSSGGGGGGQRRAQESQAAGLGQISDLLNRQISETQRIESEQLADRDAALSILGDRLGSRSDEYMRILEDLRGDPGETPFGRAVRGSVQQTLENPDVFSDQQIADLQTRIRDQGGQAVDAALRETNVDAAQRGINQSGVSDRQRQQLMLQASSDITQQIGEVELSAAQARAENLRAAQQIGASIDTATMRETTARLNALAQFVDAGEARDLEVVLGMAEILANTRREGPDYSGFASIMADLQQSSQDALLQRENLALLQQQIESNERVGIASAQAQNQYTQALAAYQSTIARLQSTVNTLQEQQELQAEQNQESGVNLSPVNTGG